MANPLVKEFKVDNQIIEIKDQNARDRITALEKGDNRGWFYVVDSYGVPEASDNPFSVQLKNAGLVVDQLSVGMMSYNGNAVNVIPQLTSKLSQMTPASIESITDIVSTLGLNDTWDNYNLITLHQSVQQFIDFCLSRFPNLQRIHLAPIGNEFDNENQANNMKLVQHVIKKCVSYNDKVLFVNNSQVAMNCPAYFKSDMVHPNAEGSQMFFDNFVNYMRKGEFPINTYSYRHELDSFGWEYYIDYVGGSCSGRFQWLHDINEFTMNGGHQFDVMFNGSVELPIMKKIQLNPSVIVTNTSNQMRRGVVGLIGLEPISPTRATLLLSGHANTGGLTDETYNNIQFYSSFSYTI